MTTGIRSFRPIVAVASAWLPVEATTMPRDFCSADSERSLVAAPRSLNDPVSCRFSSFRKTRARVPSPSACDSDSGVSRTYARMSLSAACESMKRILFGVVGEQNRDDLPAVLPFRKVQPELARPLIPLVHEDEVGIHTGDAPAHVDADVLQALGNLSPGCEVVPLAGDELIEGASADGAVVVRKCDDDRGMKQRPPLLQCGRCVKPDVIRHQPVDRGSIRFRRGLGRHGTSEND